MDYKRNAREKCVRAFMFPPWAANKHNNNNKIQRLWGKFMRNSYKKKTKRGNGNGDEEKIKEN